MNDNRLLSQALRIAVPVALQACLQSSFSMIDQIMVGRLGEQAIAAVEIAGKPGFIYTFVTGAIGTIAGIMISQYIGKSARAAETRSISVNAAAVTLTALAVMPACGAGAKPFVSLFTGDASTIADGVQYLRIIRWTFLPLGLSTVLSAALRCHDKSSWPLYAGIFSAVLNTLLNYMLIFGHFGAPALGVAGAAYASVLSQLASLFVIIVLFIRFYGRFRFDLRLGSAGFVQYMGMLGPVVINEFLWSLGQSVYTYVYGHMGTAELAGVSLTGSVQGLTIGALSGLAQAAGIMIGRRLGERKYEAAYRDAISLCVYGLLGTLPISLLLIVFRTAYASLFAVSGSVRIAGAQILAAFAVLMPVKVQNMILGGGVIRSGGRTKYIMMIDILGTWVIGVPLALLTGLVLKLPVVWVYFILSQEEVIRFIITVCMFRSRKWMVTIA